MFTFTSDISNFRLMPNIHDVDNNILTAKMSPKFNPGTSPIKLRISYILIDDKIQVAHLPQQLYKFYDLLSIGDVAINSESVLLGNSDVKSYTISERGVETNTQLPENFKQDVTYIDSPFNLYDLRLGYSFELEITTTHGFLNYKTIKFNTQDVDPVLTSNTNRSKVLKLYDNIPTLADAMNSFKQERKNKFDFE